MRILVIQFLVGMFKSSEDHVLLSTNPRSNAIRQLIQQNPQHQFVMLRARLAYTIARHGLRSLDQLEKLLLQVTRRNDIRGYERFKDLFEAIVAYNE